MSYLADVALSAFLVTQSNQDKWQRDQTGLMRSKLPFVVTTVDGGSQRSSTHPEEFVNMKYTLLRIHSSYSSA